MEEVGFLLLEGEGFGVTALEAVVIMLVAGALEETSMGTGVNSQAEAGVQLGVVEMVISKGEGEAAVQVEYQSRMLFLRRANRMRSEISFLWEYFNKIDFMIGALGSVGKYFNHNL